jgi:predicted secreted protein
MATTAPQLGKTMTLRLTGTPTVITNMRSSSLSFVTDMIDVTTKSSGTHKEYLPSFQDLTIDGEGVYTLTASTQGFEDLLTSKLAGSSVTWEYGNSAVSGSPKWSGTGYITDLSVDAPYDDVVTFTVSIQNTGDPTVGTYA